MTTGRFGHVLVVDDEPVLAGVVASYLERAGFSTTIMLDLGLPGLDASRCAARSVPSATAT
jgi:DNA-binding response OmpR family regulator